MPVPRAIRAWFGSAVACVVLLAAWIAALQILSGRTSQLLHNVLDVAVGFGAIFAVTAALVYIPVFLLHGALFRRDLPRTHAVCLGAALAPIAYFAVAWQVRDSEGPQTVAAWLVYFGGHIRETAIGILPFLLAGAVFGVLWSGGRLREFRAN